MPNVFTQTNRSFLRSQAAAQQAEVMPAAKEEAPAAPSDLKATRAALREPREMSARARHDARSAITASRVVVEQLTVDIEARAKGAQGKSHVDASCRQLANRWVKQANELFVSIAEDVAADPSFKENADMLALEYGALKSRAGQFRTLAAAKLLQLENIKVPGATRQSQEFAQDLVNAFAQIEASASAPAEAFKNLSLLQQ